MTPVPLIIALHLGVHPPVESSAPGLTPAWYVDVSQGYAIGAASHHYQWGASGGYQWTPTLAFLALGLTFEHAVGVAHLKRDTGCEAGYPCGMRATNYRIAPEFDVGLRTRRVAGYLHFVGGLAVQTADYATPRRNRPFANLGAGVGLLIAVWRGLTVAFETDYSWNDDHYYAVKLLGGWRF